MSNKRDKKYDKELVDIIRNHFECSKLQTQEYLGLINKEELGLALLRLVQIIGEDKVTDVGPDTLYFIVSVLNQLDLDKIRNNILLKVLPLKV